MGLVCVQQQRKHTTRHIESRLERCDQQNRHELGKLCHQTLSCRMLVSPLAAGQIPMRAYGESIQRVRRFFALIGAYALRLCHVEPPLGRQAG